MPYLTRRSNIKDEGAIVEIVIVPSEPVAAKLRQEQKTVPSFKAIALIDTGSSISSITQPIVDALGLNVHDIQGIGTPKGKKEGQFLYDVAFILPISMRMALAVQVVCADLEDQPYQALIGRDILSMCTLFYNGADGSFTLHL